MTLEKLLTPMQRLDLARSLAKSAFLELDCRDCPEHPGNVDNRLTEAIIYLHGGEEEREALIAVLVDAEHEVNGALGRGPDYFEDLPIAELRQMAGTEDD